MNNNQLYNKILKDISKVVKTSINEAFNFGSVGKPVNKNDAIVSAVRHEALKQNIEEFFELCKDYMMAGNIVIDNSSSNEWIMKSQTTYGGDRNYITLKQAGASLEISIDMRYMDRYSNMAANKTQNDMVFDLLSKASDYHINIGTANLINSSRFCIFNNATLFEMNPTNLPSKINFQELYNDNIEDVHRFCVITKVDNGGALNDSVMPMVEYMQDCFADMIFVNFAGAEQDFVNEKIYKLGIPNVQEYLKQRKLKCEAKDLQRVEDLLKKGKSCEAMAKAIGEKNISKAGSRFVAALRLLNLPVPPIDDNDSDDIANQIKRFYEDFRNINTHVRSLVDVCAKVSELKPEYFLIKFLQLGGTMQDIFAMYDASFGDEENPDTISNRQQKINDFQGTSVKKYGRLKDFVIFLDSLNIPYEVEPIDSRITDRWTNPQAWQGVTLFDDDDPNTAHFAITSSEGAARGHGTRTGSTRITGGWHNGRYRSVYAPEYAENGNWRMEGELEITHISDNLLPFIQEGPINLTKLRTAIQKFLKSLK